MKKGLLLGGLLFCLFGANLFSQLNVRVQVEKIAVLANTDCDAGASDNSDFLFEYKATDNSPSSFSNNAPVAGSIGMCNYAYVAENNGPYAIFTATPGLAVFSPTNGVFFNRNYNCIQDVPTNLNIVWRAYENDDVTAPSTTPVAGGITAINSTIVNLPAQASSTLQTITYTATSSGACTQTYEITFRIAVTSGTFSPLQITNVDYNVICNGANNGHLEVYTSGGSGTVLYDWSNDGINDFDDASSVAGLSPGIYTITVKDGLNCTHSATTSVTSIAPPTTPGSFITSTSTVCAGQTAVAYAVASQTNAVFDWTYNSAGTTVNGNGNAAITLDFSNSAQSGTLSVYAQNSCSVSPTLTMAITVTPKPVISINGTNSMCDNVQSVLTATGATTYTWSTGANSTSITVTPTTTTIYTVSGTANSCTSVSGQFTMTVLPSPTVQISGSTATVCPSQTVALSATGNGSIFVWSDGFIGANHTISSAATVVYTVSNILNSCIGQATYTLNVHPLPAISVSGNTIVCPGKTVTLTATGANTYSWSSGSSNASMTYTPSGMTTLTVTGTSTAGCISSKTVSTGNYAAGLVSITGNTAICNTQQGVLTASGSNFYLWNNGSTGPTNTISPTSSTTVSVVGTTLDGCKDSTSVSVMVINNLSIAISGPDSICAGQSAVLNANVSGATTYSWNTGAQTASITVSPATTFTYIVTASNPGCSGSKQHQVFVKPLPSIEFEVTSPLCTDAGSYSLTATPSGGIYLGSGISGNNFDPSVGVGIYPVTYQVTGSNGCSASSTQTIEVVICVGINEQETDSFISVYPNPSHGKVNIRSGVQLKSVSVMDYTGKLILHTACDATTTEVDLSGFASGIYTFALVDVNGATRVMKLVKE